MSDPVFQKALLEMQKLNAPVSKTGTSEFGICSAVSPNGKVLAIATDNVSNGVPGVFIYAKEDGVWKHESTIVSQDARARATFGHALSFNEEGDILAIGAYTDSEKLPFSGAVYIYQKLGSVWHKRKIRQNDPTVSAIFGGSVKLSRDGNLLVVGAQNAQNQGSMTGAVYVFERDRNGDWIQTGKLAAEDGVTGNCFGSDIALSADGSTLAVGSPGYNSGKGCVYIFVLRNGVFENATKVAETNSLGIGDAVALSADGTVLVALGQGVDLTYDTMAYVYKKTGVVYMREESFTKAGARQKAAFMPRVTINDSGTHFAVTTSSAAIRILETTRNDIAQRDLLVPSEELDRVKHFSAAADFSVFVEVSREIDVSGCALSAAYIFG